MKRKMILVLLGLCFQISTGSAQQPDAVKAKSPKLEIKGQFKTLQKGSSVLSLLPDGGLWVDLSRKWVVADGEICLRNGPLEMFACPQGTKEHESVVAVKSSARFVHAALLAIGAKTGKPVKFDPEYIPASGSVIDIICVWKDEKGKIRSELAQNWVTKGRSKKTLEHAWVFAGSGFWTEASTGKKRYYGDDGSLICVSNFPTATMDIAVESSKDNNFLEYHANAYKVPELKTPVRLVLVNRPGDVTKKAPRSLTDNAEILSRVRLWAEAIEAGKEPAKSSESNGAPAAARPADN
ncbi:MAG: hypothetical protein CMJ76_01670 [Planctomycetaceae bacterium]|nr:hypothetical protein [Planctomycetaceae bacterium]